MIRTTWTIPNLSRKPASNYSAKPDPNPNLALPVTIFMASFRGIQELRCYCG